MSECGVSYLRPLQVRSASSEGVWSVLPEAIAVRSASSERVWSVLPEAIAGTQR